MVLGSALDIFSREGFSYLSRWSHVFVGITWIGLLYFFNFVQVPAYAQMEAERATTPSTSSPPGRCGGSAGRPRPRSSAASRRVHRPEGALQERLHEVGARRRDLAGILLAVTMFLNVWLVIWPNQKKVIANARNVQAGGEADPNARRRAAQALLASRMNMIYSLPMLIFMVGTSHFPYDFFLTTRRRHADLLGHLDRDLGPARAQRARPARRDGARRRGSSTTVMATRYTSFVYSFATLLLFSYVLLAVSRALEADEVGDARPVLGGVAEQQRARLHPAHVQVHVVLPRVADAAVDLDALFREQRGSRRPLPSPSTSRARRSSSSAIVSAAK